MALSPHFTAYGSNAKNLALFIAVASSRCFFADTAVILLGTIFPRPEMYLCNNLVSLYSIRGAVAPEKGQTLRRRKNGLVAIVFFLSTSVNQTVHADHCDLRVY